MIPDLERAKNHVHTWPLNDLELEDQGHVKVNFKFLMGNFHFLPRTQREHVDLTMTVNIYRCVPKTSRMKFRPITHLT